MFTYTGLVIVLQIMSVFSTGRSCMCKIFIHASYIDPYTPSIICITNNIKFDIYLLFVIMNIYLVNCRRKKKG